MCECGDNVLKTHLEEHRGGRGHYISPVSQNNLIDCVGKVMARNVVQLVHESEFYSILADETTDVSDQEQLRLCLRFVINYFSVQERFLQFEIVSDLTAKGIAGTIKRLLHENN